MNEPPDPQLPQGGRWVLLKVLSFSVGLALVFTLVANTLPQVEGEAPVDAEVDLGALTMDGFVALGEILFEGKGTCTLCHNNMGRAPDILVLNMVQVAGERLADSRYAGGAGDEEAYLRESMVDPGAYVVKGYGKKGSDDTISPMPAVHKAPISLTDVEIDAVIAFMQAKDGHPVTVALPTETPAMPAETATAAASDTPPPAATLDEAVAKYGCAACHTMMGTESVVGPSLEGIAERMDPEQIRRAIVDPNADVAEGFAPNIMPLDFAERMTVRELDMIVGYLAGEGGG